MLCQIPEGKDGSVSHPVDILRQKWLTPFTTFKGHFQPLGEPCCPCMTLTIKQYCAVCTTPSAHGTHPHRIVLQFVTSCMSYALHKHTEAQMGREMYRKSYQK